MSDMQPRTPRAAERAIEAQQMLNLVADRYVAARVISHSPHLEATPGPCWDEQLDNLLCQAVEMRLRHLQVAFAERMGETGR